MGKKEAFHSTCLRDLIKITFHSLCHAHFSYFPMQYVGSPMLYPRVNNSIWQCDFCALNSKIKCKWGAGDSDRGRVVG